MGRGEGGTRVVVDVEIGVRVESVIGNVLVVAGHVEN